MTGCQLTSKKIIEKSCLEKDWVINNKHILFIEDSYVFTGLIHNSIPVSKYKLVDDTLIIYSKSRYKEDSVIKEYKYKILELDSNKLKITVASNHSYIYSFRKFDSIRYNNLNFKRLEFSCGPCFGPCPILDIKITEDSVLYLFGYRHTKHNGLFKHKLNNKEYQKVQNKLNTILKDSFYLSASCPDAPTYNLFVKADNDSVDISGTTGDSVSFNLSIFIDYLISLDYLLDLKATSDENIIFKNDFNSHWLKEYQRNKRLEKELKN